MDGSAVSGYVSSVTAVNPASFVGPWDHSA